MVLLIHVTIQDIHGQRFVVQTQNDAQVLGLKLQIWEARSIAPDNQRLVFAGRQLSDEESLNTTGVENGSVIFMVQQNEQTQAVVQQPQVAQQQPVVYAPQVVQPMNVVAVPPQQVVVQPQPQPQPQPQIIVNLSSPETCCCCMPLRAGTLVILILSVLVHLAVSPGVIWIGIMGLVFDVLGIYGWWKHMSKRLMLWVWFEGITLVLSAIFGVVMMIIFEVRGGHFHHHHHFHHHGHGHGTTTTTWSPSTTTSEAPRKLTGQEKAIIGSVWILGVLFVSAVGGYYIRAVYRYVKELREEERNGSPAPVQMVNGVAYQQV